MTITSQARVAPGIPTGGQFAAQSRPESEVSLELVGKPFKLPSEHLNEAINLSRLDVLDHIRARAGKTEIDDSYAVAAAGVLHDRTPGGSAALLAVSVLGRVDHEAIAEAIAGNYRHFRAPERAIADALGTWSMNHERDGEPVREELSA